MVGGGRVRHHVEEWFWSVREGSVSYGCIMQPRRTGDVLLKLVADDRVEMGDDRRLVTATEQLQRHTADVRNLRPPVVCSIRLLSELSLEDF